MAAWRGRGATRACGALNPPAWGAASSATSRVAGAPHPRRTVRVTISPTVVIRSACARAPAASAKACR